MTQKRIPNQPGEEPKGAVEVLAPGEATPFDPPDPDAAAKKPKKKQAPLEPGLLETAVALFGVAALADLFDGGETDEDAADADLGDGFDI
jgi:hypothetical protein